MKISAHTQLLYLELTGTPAFTSAAECVVLGMIQVVNVANIGAKFPSKDLGIKGRFFGTAVAVQPCEVAESERSFRFSWRAGRIYDLRFCRGLRPELHCSL